MINVTLKELEKIKNDAPLFSEEYFEAVKNIAKFYYDNQAYSKALNELKLIENKGFKEEWLNFCIVAAVLHTNSKNYFENPKKHFFERLNKYTDAEFDNQRKAIFKEALNIFIDGFRNIFHKIDEDAFYAEAELLNLTTSDEWKKFIDVVCPSRKNDFLTVLSKECEDDNPSEIDRLRSENKKLKEELETLKNSKNLQIVEKHENVPENFDKIKILIVGDTQPNVQELYGKAKKRFNLEKQNFDIWNDYDKIVKLVSRIKPYENKYNAIILGPMPHKTSGSGDCSSFIENLKKNPEGYPYCIEAKDKRGTLKINVSSFLEALARIMEHLHSFPE